jgi:RimJ/RimL family protein N-acetyltransferase
MLVLKTERLDLRWATPADADFICGLLNEPSWLQNIGDRGVRTAEDARAWIEERLLGNCWAQGFGFWAVERAADGVLIGICGLVLREGLPDVDVGYAFVPQFWGQGFAREAAGACLQYGREVLGLRRVLALTNPDNAASGRVLEAIGLRLEETRVLDGQTSPSRIYGWTDPAEPLDDAAQIDFLLRRFFAAFSNRQGVPTLAALPYWMLPQAHITRGEAGGLASLSLRQFIEPRAELLRPGGRLQDFEETVLEQRIEQFGRIAQVWLRYTKSGRLDGEPCNGEGYKTLQLLKTARGWRIAALAWQDLG